MLTHPQFDPVLFSLGPVAVRWYGLMYVVAFVAFVMLGKYRARKGLGNGVTEEGVDDMLLYGVLGVILGRAAGLRALLQARVLPRRTRWRSCRSGRGA